MSEHQFKSSQQANSETEDVNFEMIKNEIEFAISEGRYECNVPKERLSQLLKKNLENEGYLVYDGKNNTTCISW